MQVPPRVRANIGISHSPFKIIIKNTVWTPILKQSGLVVDEHTDLSRGANEDVIATDVRTAGENITRKGNVYHQTDRQSGERPAQKVNCQRVIRQGGTVLKGDINTHSRPWDPRCLGQRKAAFWEEVIDKNGLEMGNDGQSTHLWTRDGHQGESVIDLTLANRPITQWSILADVHATGSDHQVIEWHVE